MLLSVDSFYTSEEIHITLGGAVCQCFTSVFVGTMFVSPVSQELHLFTIHLFLDISVFKET